jgi:hypothetical protein
LTVSTRHSGLSKKFPIDFRTTIVAPYLINKNYQIKKSIGKGYYLFRAVQQLKEKQYVTH